MLISNNLCIHVGMIVPQKSDSGERKGPVRYGSKIKKQKRPEQATVSSPADESESLIDGESIEYYIVAINFHLHIHVCRRNI